MLYYKATYLCVNKPKKIMKKLSIIVVSLLATMFLFSCKKDVVIAKKIPSNYQSIDFLVEINDISKPFTFNITSSQNQLSSFEKYFCDFGDGHIDSFNTNVGGSQYQYIALGTYHLKIYFKPNSLADQIEIGNSKLNTVLQIESNNFNYLQGLTSLYLSNNKISNIQLLSFPNSFYRIVLSNNILTQQSIDNVLKSIKNIPSLKSWGIVKLDYQNPNTSPSSIGMADANIIKNAGWIVDVD